MSTPIGNMKDISQRAIETLRSVDIIFCEDTRVSSKLLDSLSIRKPLKVYNDHNAQRAIDIALNYMLNKQKVAIISDAGTPLISDPGYKLVNACIKNNLSYTVIPGCCSPIAALTLSGFPTDRFVFCGFFNSDRLEEYKHMQMTLIFFESPKRIIETLNKMKLIFCGRDVAVVREITKIYEETVRGSFDDVIRHFDQNEAKGECIILLSPQEQSNKCEREIFSLADRLKDKLTNKDISSILSEHFKVSKNDIYKYLISKEEE
ncbi:MAG: 16S rRNA (cytidine(1402)-2'-O)-methyltransferase [Alphaproteobacteria bacterium]|nr:16S rRNA (cytidine(1402)-2'-O)-methyltransferase [Alphaproteobacteria bacterium]